METNTPQRDEEEVRAFVENMSAMFADYGLPRMAARVLIVELVAEEESLTAADLAERLGVSPAAISGALKYLLHIGLFARDSIPNSRRDRYRMVDQSWFTASFLKAGFLKRLADEADKGIPAVGGVHTEAGARVAELRDFYQFMSDEIPGMLDKWFKSRTDPPVSSTR